MLTNIAGRISSPPIWWVAGAVVIALVLVVASWNRRLRLRRQREQTYLENLSERLPAAASPTVRSDRLLPDRQSLEGAIQRQMAPSSQEHPGTAAPFSLVYVEVLDWRELTRDLGPQAAETLLMSISQRLQSLLRPEDSLAHIPPAGFAFLVRDAGLRAHQYLLAAVEPLLSRDFLINQHPLKLRCALGASRYPDAGDSATALLDVAMRLRYEFGTRVDTSFRARHA